MFQAKVKTKMQTDQSNLYIQLIIEYFSISLGIFSILSRKFFSLVGREKNSSSAKHLDQLFLSL